MKINIRTFKFLGIAFIFSISSFAFTSCGSTKVVEPPKEEQPVQASVEEKAEQPVPTIEEPQNEPLIEKEEPAVDDEYSRSVGEVSVSRDTFEEDKARILKIIENLSIIMKDMDYKSWIKYVDSESINYYSQSSNLKKAQNRLPVKGLQLKSLQDYFKYVFVPARASLTVNEIRYISDTYIKAIEVQQDQDIVCYYFNKINGYWMVHIPPID